MRRVAFDFDLPEHLIAQEPLSARDSSRMMQLDRVSGHLQDRQFRDLPGILRPGDLLVVNNARVFPLRLLGRRRGTHAQPARKDAGSFGFLSAEIEVLLLREMEPDLWEALVRPGRKVRTGEIVEFGDGALLGTVESRASYGARRIRFETKGDLKETIRRIGHVPLPPYISRLDVPGDRERYQTIFARHGIAAAAPTAGLHFTPEMVSALQTTGIEIRELTLEVGLGTFEPIRTEEIEEHAIHSERYEIPEATAEAIARTRRDGRRVIAVGTTVVRALEDSTSRVAVHAPAHGAKDQPVVQPGKAEAEIYLYPGKEFRVVDGLLTNFHLPQSSLLVMVAAFAGREHILAAYRHAVDAGYRFYSYGDCMLIV